MNPNWQHGNSKTIQLGTKRSAVIYTRGEDVVWLRLETLDNQQCTTAFTCFLSPGMASDIAGTLENAQIGVSETHIGSGTKIKVNWANMQSELFCVLVIETAAGIEASAFMEEAGRRLASAFRWAASKSSNNIPSGDASIRAVDRKRDDLMKAIFSGE